METLRKNREGIIKKSNNKQEYNRRNNPNSTCYYNHCTFNPCGSNDCDINWREWNINASQ